MLTETLLGLGVPALGGLTYVAYRHPKGYARIYRAAGYVVAAVAIFAVGWLYGTQEVYARLLELLQRDQMAPARAIMDDLAPSAAIVLILLGITGYTAFLYALPQILDLQDGEDKQKDDRERP